jgi:hypothetical protein
VQGSSSSSTTTTTRSSKSGGGGGDDDSDEAQQQARGVARPEATWSGPAVGAARVQPRRAPPRAARTPSRARGRAEEEGSQSNRKTCECAQKGRKEQEGGTE